MTDTAGPFDGTPWAEAQWVRHAAAWAPSGCYGTPGTTTTGDLPLSVSGLSVGLGAGRAWVRGIGFERTGAAVMQTVTANTHASFNRRDRIVLRRNLATHTLTPVLITGTPAGTPAAPALTQSETGAWDVPMFSFLVPPSSGTSITDIVDERLWLAFPETGPAGALCRPVALTGSLGSSSGGLAVGATPTVVVPAGRLIRVRADFQLYIPSGNGQTASVWLERWTAAGALVAQFAGLGKRVTAADLYDFTVEGEDQVTTAGTYQWKVAGTMSGGAAATVDATAPVGSIERARTLRLSDVGPIPAS